MYIYNRPQHDKKLIKKLECDSRAENILGIYVRNFGYQCCDKNIKLTAWALFIILMPPTAVWIC